MPVPITIAQDQVRSKLAYSLQRRANIDLVGLTDLVAKCKANVQDVAFPLQFWLHYQAEQACVVGQKLTSPVQFRFRVTDAKEIEALSLECVIRADYDLSEGYQPTVEEIAAFTESNAIFNCWPYFRELVQSTLTRMNYPPLSIPFLRLVPKVQRKNRPVQTELVEEGTSQRMLEAPMTAEPHERKEED